MKPLRDLSRRVLILLSVGFWIGATIALAAWWWVHGLSQVELLSTLQPELASHVETQKRMLFWEGTTLISLMSVGGVSILSLLIREWRRNKQMHVFFASFTHELKTPLASLRLQAEALQEDLGGSARNVLVDRLLADASRLELQMDNALFLATVEKGDQIHLETLRLSAVVERVQSAFPGFSVTVDRDVDVLADRRALESVLKNLIQNARVHGQAQSLQIATESHAGHVHVHLQDDGQGFSGDAAVLGQLFHRPTTRSGSGIGIHLVRTLMARMGGSFAIVRADAGFAVELGFRTGGAE